MVLVFDLDDTLYEEITFVKSGFKAVATFLEPILRIPADQLFSDLETRLQDGRGAIFDDVLKQHKYNSKPLVRQCLSVYRLHKPVISLYPDAIRCLNRFIHFPLYIVTDGNKLVQHQKVLTLGVQEKVKKVFITHRYGIKNAKPSVYCFERIRQLEKTETSQIVYIGDNPAKDFVGLKPLGYKTIRILRGNYRHLQPGPTYEADRNIGSLDELTEDLLKNI